MSCQKSSSRTFDSTIKTSFTAACKCMFPSPRFECRALYRRTTKLSLLVTQFGSIGGVHLVGVIHGSKVGLYLISPLATMPAKSAKRRPVQVSQIKSWCRSGSTNRFDEIMVKAAERARALVNIEHVGMPTAFIASEFAALITGDTMVIHDKTISCLGSGKLAPESAPFLHPTQRRFLG